MNVVDRLVELVGIPSVSGNEGAIADVVESLVRTSRPKWPLARLGNNLVVGPVRAPSAPPGRPLVGLVGHLDTVPAQGNANPTVRDDAVWGVGATDMKGGVAVMCDLVETLPDALGVDVVFVFYDKEEVGFDENGLASVLPAYPFLGEIDLAIVLEPTNLAVELGCNGHLLVNVTFHGTAAHSARPWTGENAIHRAAPFIAAIDAAGTQEIVVGEATYRQTIQITQAEGGVARNVIPDRFLCRVSHRFPPGRSVADAEAYVRSFLPEGATVDVELEDVAPPGAVPVANAVYERFRTRIRPEIRGKQGWTDVARLSAAGIDAINYGPGIPELCHRVDERCPIAHLHHVRDALATFVSEPFEAGATGAGP